MRTAKKVWTYFAIVLLALIAAVNYELFVFPNQFAPAGLNGICTMIQHLSGISVGYLSLLINVPLALWCFFDVSRPLAIRSMVYVVTFSVGLLILENIDITAFAYSTENGTSKILGPMVAGVIQGFVYSVLVKASAYTGGTDFISAAIHKHHPDRPFFGMNFSINAAIAICSYFVYGFQMEPVILCILYTFMSTTVGDRLMKSGREAISFEIITDHPTEVSKALIEKLHHTTTMIPAKGMYKGKETSVLLCVVNKTQEASVARIVRNYPHTFAIVHPVSEILGNFKHLDSDGKNVPEVLDSGDGQTL